MKMINAMTALTASAISRGNRNRQLRRINKTNIKNRNIRNLGCVTKESLFPEKSFVGNVCLSGNDYSSRNDLFIHTLKQAVSVGETVIVLHEGDYQLEADLANAFYSVNYLRFINSNNPYYDPIFRLDDSRIISLILSSSLKDHQISDKGILYLRGLLMLLRKTSITPYLNKLLTCPHDRIQNIILSAEQSGVLSVDDAVEIRNNIDEGKEARPSIEYMFSELSNMSSSIISNKTQLLRSTSVIECVRHNGILVIDVGSMSNKALLSLIVAEINMIKKSNKYIRIAVSADSVMESEAMKDLLKSASKWVGFTISTKNIGSFSGTDRSELETFLALSQKAIMFSHGVRSAELLSSELGEYDFIEAHCTRGGNTGLGGFGLLFGSNNAIKPEHKRERVVKAEEIEHLNEREFIMLDNSRGELYAGKLK